MHYLTIVSIFFYPQVATWVTTPELLSTEMRTVGHSSCTAVSKLCSFLAPYLIISSLSYFSIGLVLGLLNVIAAVAANLLPETSHGECCGVCVCVFIFAHPCQSGTIANVKLVCQFIFIVQDGWYMLQKQRRTTKRNTVQYSSIVATVVVLVKGLMEARARDIRC